MSGADAIDMRRDAPRPIAVIVDREGLGDSLLKLPLLRALHRGYSGRQIWWIASHQTAMAENLRPFVGDMIAEVKPFAGLTGAALEMIPRLQALPPFSLVFDTRTRLGSVLLARRFLRCEAFFCALPGYVLSDARPPGRFARPRNVGLRALSLAEAALGGKTDGGGVLRASAASLSMAAALLPPGRNYIGLVVGSREARKNWPLECFGALAQKLAARGLVPVLLTGPQEQAQAAEIARLVDSAIDAGPAIAPLDAAIAVAGRLSLAVANDSGLGHLCGAAGTPVVSLFGPTDWRRWAPMAPRLRVLRARDFGGDAMSRIPVEAVDAAVDELLRHGAGGERQ